MKVTVAARETVTTINNITEVIRSKYSLGKNAIKIGGKPNDKGCQSSDEILYSPNYKSVYAEIFNLH